MGPGAAAFAARHVPSSPAPEARGAQVAMIATRLELRGPTTDADAADAVAAAPARPKVASAPYRLTGALESSRDLDCLTAAVYYEARGEGQSGQAAVAQVVLNRVRHPAFPKTVCGVVYQGAANRACQFSFACDGAMRRGREGGAWDRARIVAARALSGYVMPLVGRATHFHVASLGGVWGGSMSRVAQVGQHIFYTFNGHAAALGGGRTIVADAEPAAAAAPTADGALDPRLAVVTASADGVIAAATAAVPADAPKPAVSANDRAKPASAAAPAATPSAPAAQS
ncbi:MAG: cell wall hydrolase [Caulobacterales bacterium]